MQKRVKRVWKLNYEQLVALNKSKHREERPPRKDVLSLALLILRDECPPDNTMYLCNRCEEHDSECCQRCWTTFLFWAANGYKEVDRPYKESDVWVK